MDIHGAGAANVGYAPHAGEQLVAGKNLARIAHQKLQQPELQPRQVNGVSVGGNLVSGRVEGNGAHADDFRIGIGSIVSGGSGAAAGQTQDAFQQFRRGAGDDDEVVSVIIEVGVVQAVGGDAAEYRRGSAVVVCRRILL